MRNRKQVIKIVKQEDKSSDHCYIFFKCLIILAFLLWLTGEDRLIVKRAKTWSWAYNFVEQMKKWQYYTGENWVLFMQEDIQNLMTHLILQGKDRIRNTVQGYTFQRFRERVFTCLYLSVFILQILYFLTLSMSLFLIDIHIQMELCFLEL